MMIFRNKRNRWGGAVILLVLFTVASLYAPFAAPHAQAQSFAQGVGACALSAAVVGGIQEALSFFGLSVPVGDWKQFIIQSVFNCVVWVLKIEIIEDLTGQSLGYVQTGFDGNPVYVENLDQLAGKTITDAFEEYLPQYAAYLCSPFSVQIQLALTQLVSRQSPVQCTLSRIVANAERFIEGNFEEGGWAGWFELTTNPVNNPYGAYLAARGDLSNKIRVRLGNQQKELDWGQGFFSKKLQTCYAPTPTGGRIPVDLPAGSKEVAAFPPGACDKPKIVLPGGFSFEATQNIGKVGLDLTVAADALNELIPLATAYLLSDILTGIYGLTGYLEEDFTHELPDDFFDTPPIPGTGPTEPHDDQPPGPPGPSTCFAANGTFSQPTPESAEAYIDLPLPRGTSYDRIEVELDVMNGGFHPLVDDHRYTMFWLPRGANRDLFGYAVFNGPSANTVVLRHGVGQTHGAKARKSAGMEFQPGDTYHFRYIYDVGENEIDLTVTNAGNGNQIAHLTSIPDVPGINVGNEQFLIGFSFPYPSIPGNPIEVASIDWEYKDLRVSFLSDGDDPGACGRASVSHGPREGGRENDDPIPGGPRIPDVRNDL